MQCHRPTSQQLQEILVVVENTGYTTDKVDITQTKIVLFSFEQSEFLSSFPRWR